MPRPPDSLQCLLIFKRIDENLISLYFWHLSLSSEIVRHSNPFLIGNICCSNPFSTVSPIFATPVKNSYQGLDIHPPNPGMLAKVNYFNFKHFGWRSAPIIGVLILAVIFFYEFTSRCSANLSGSPFHSHVPRVHAKENTYYA